MTPRELERLEKDSIYTLRLTNELRDQVINGYMNELNKVVRRELKRKQLAIFLLKE